MFEKLIKHLNEPALKMHKVSQDQETGTELDNQEYVILTWGALYVTYIFILFAPDVYQLIAPYFFVE